MHGGSLESHPVNERKGYKSWTSWIAPRDSASWVDASEPDRIKWRSSIALSESLAIDE